MNNQIERIKKKYKDGQKVGNRNCFNCMHTSRDRFLVQLLWESGMWIGEVLALWIEDVEPDAH